MCAGRSNTLDSCLGDLLDRCIFGCDLKTFGRIAFCVETDVFDRQRIRHHEASSRPALPPLAAASMVREET